MQYIRTRGKPRNYGREEVYSTEESEEELRNYGRDEVYRTEEPGEIDRTTVEMRNMIQKN